MSGKKIFMLILLSCGCSFWAAAQDAPRQELTITPPRESEPWSEAIGNDPSDAPPAINTPVADPGIPMNTSPARAAGVETASPVVPISETPTPSAAPSPVHTSPAKAVSGKEKGAPK